MRLLQSVSAFGSDRVSLGRGEVLFRQGERGDDLYVVTSGRLRALVEGETGQTRVVGEIGRGEPVGELAVLGDCERAATVVAVRRTELLRVTRPAYDRLRGEHPEALLELLGVIAQRLRRSNQSGPESAIPTSIAVVPTGAGLELESGCRRLADRLAEPLHSVRWLRSRDVPGRKKSEARISQWLNEQEALFDTLLLQADPTPSDWSRCCLRQADRILLVAEAHRRPSPGPLEKVLAEFDDAYARPRIDLVLLQTETPYRRTAEWLGSRSVSGHFHLRADVAADWDRLARHLAGRDVALVLGGGGARGLAHIGVVRACRELGIPIDRVVGTSIGALVGAWVATGADWKQIAAALAKGFPNSRHLRSRTVPAISIDSGRRYTEEVEGMFGAIQIEDLPIECVCISTNVSRARVEAHRSGRLATWVLTSMTVPGIAPPYILDGDLLVDGGVLNNLPIDIARQDGAGRVLGVDVSPKVELTHPPGTRGRPGNWAALRSWIPLLRRDRPRAPSLFALLNRVGVLSSASTLEQKRALADVLVRVPVEGYRMFEWERRDELVELGYRTGMEQLPAWRLESKERWE